MDTIALIITCCLLVILLAQQFQIRDIGKKIDQLLKRKQ